MLILMSKKDFCVQSLLILIGLTAVLRIALSKHIFRYQLEKCTAQCCYVISLINRMMERSECSIASRFAALHYIHEAIQDQDCVPYAQSCHYY